MRLPRPLVSGLLALIGLASACSDAPPRALPDVLLVSLDTLRGDRLSAGGYERETTPFLDGLAARGVRFAQAHAPAQHTAPSHMSLFTGLDPLAHQVRNMADLSKPVPTLSLEVPTLPELLREAGYRTVAITDRGNLLPEMGFGRGFDREEAYFDELPRKVKLAREVIAEQDPDEPLFLFFHTYAVHSPYLPRGRFAGLFTDPAYDGPFRARYEEIARASPLEAWGAAGAFLEPWEDMGADDVRFLAALYDEGVAYADSQVQRLFAAWTELRGRDDTVLVVTSDHGEELFEHGSLGHRRGLHRELVHVPLILVAPGLEPRVVAEPVSLTGLLGTLAELLDLSVPDVQGASFLDLARGDARLGIAYSQDLGSRRAGQFASVTTHTARLIQRSGQEVSSLALYDAADELETRDLAGERPAEVEALRERLTARRVEGIRRQELYPTSATSLRAGDLASREELSALGYLSDDDK